MSEGASSAELSFLPDGTGIAGGIGSPGAIFYNAAALQSCTATGFVVSQGTIASDQGTLAATLLRFFTAVLWQIKVDEGKAGGSPVRLINPHDAVLMERACANFVFRGGVGVVAS